MVRGSPAMCMSTSAAPPRAAMPRLSGSADKALMSLTISAPSLSGVAGLQAGVGLGAFHPGAALGDHRLFERGLVVDALHLRLRGGQVGDGLLQAVLRVGGIEPDEQLAR